jgi:hypothetical protein
LLFTRDDTIDDLYQDIQDMGSRDPENLVLLNYIFCKDLINKAFKAIYVKNDHRFALSFMMSGIRRMASIEGLLNQRIPLRESTSQAIELNPEIFSTIFTEMVSKSPCDKTTLERILQTMERYLQQRLDTFVQPLQRLLGKKGEMTHDALETHFNVRWLPLDLREFVEMGLLTQVEAPFRFTKKSSSEMLQPAYQLAKDSDSMIIDEFVV